ncbi:acyl-homoserine-lactone synthase [Paludibacterium purpuratum]|uniref:Acyl-homoserine-lactone synthase n=1 Tax=Paludibacterium purpuratum TaxID=1144873 RepID=A0A4R7B5S6_9NEIS|nr:acyl-homoserine-lactone synthase [Paludibacterium purpuratum]TDR79763.1 acyl homoserine lactone synthase [Paludibacterium purpuratum]
MNSSALDIQIARRTAWPVSDLENMWRLRAEIFYYQMGWDVHVENGMERDSYDELDPHYLLMKRHDGSVQGCMRLLPTLGPNMLRDVFPSLLRGQPIPADAHTWELSRFVFARSGTAEDHPSRLAQIRAALHQLSCFAQARDIRHFVMVTTPAVQHLLDQLGIRALPLCLSTRFGIDNAVVLDVPLTAANRRAVAPIAIPLTPVSEAYPVRA